MVAISKASRTHRALAAAAIAALLVGGGAVVANAAIPGVNGVIKGCYSRSGGALRVVDEAASCSKTELSVNWNVQGPVGPTGATGPTGPKGDAGAVGSSGAPGPQGPAGATGPAGPAGTDGAPGPQGVPGAQGPQGPAGPIGPSGDSGILAMQFVSANAPAPSGTEQFLSPTVPLTVTAAGQKIFVTVSRAFGAGATPANSLNLHVCYRTLGSVATPQLVGSGVFGLTAAANTRHTETLSAVISGLATGGYEVGMCGLTGDGNLNWTNNEFGYTTGILAAS
jgi:hypothetical protein